MALPRVFDLYSGVGRVRGARARTGDPLLPKLPRRLAEFSEGDYWSVIFEGRTVRVRDLTGMRYLARLLADPGREYHVLDLVAAETGGRAQGDSSQAASLPRSALGLSPDQGKE